MTTPQHSVHHSTLVLERSYAAPPARVFAAWADPAIKQRWFAEGEGFVVGSYSLDFRVGGREHGRFTGNGAQFGNDGIIHDIVPNHRIVVAYTMTADERRISASLGTVELHPSGTGTRLVYTEQAAFFEGSDGPKLREQGWRGLFDRLGAELGAAR